MARYDAIGMFWEDRASERGRGPIVRQQPPIPDTGWYPPREFPNLSAARVLSIDTETHDPELTDNGPGWGRGPGKGHIVGVSIAAEGSPGWYFPIRHTIEPEFNLDAAQVLRWLDHVLHDDRPKVGANLLYDLGWLNQEGVRVGGRKYDIQYAEALLNSEAPDVSLEALATKYLGMGKETSVLYQWCADFYGGKANGRQRANIYRSPPRLAGPYAEADARLPLLIMNQQWPALVERGVAELFDLECRLIPLLLEMRKKGAPVDIPGAERMYDQLGQDMLDIERRIKEATGRTVNPNSGAEIAKAFDAVGIQYPRTEAGNPSFTAPVLEAIDHPLAQLIVDHRQRGKVRGTFIKSYLLDSHTNGRVHCQFHPLKSDDSGARSGRFSSSDPNLQNIPIRTEIGKQIRNLFIATGRWRKFDYSQIEYRMLAHHAVGQGSDDIRRRYNENPDTDYHEATGEMIKSMVGLDLPRRNLKTINFGLIYGMGKAELIKRLGLNRAKGSDLFKAYHRAVPFALATMDAAAAEVHQFGTVTTILGRKSDFPLWGPKGDAGYGMPALPFDQALMAYGSIERAYTHKALNRKLQGGAADIMKKAMVDCYEQGIFAETGIPMLTVHDELDFDDTGDEYAPCWLELQRVLETCVTLRVPIMVGVDHAKRWGDCG